MPPLAPWHRYLQLVIYGSIGQSLIATMLAVSGVIHLDPNLIGFSYLGAIASLGLSMPSACPCFQRRSAVARVVSATTCGTRAWVRGSRGG